MSLHLENPEQEVQRIVEFLQKIFHEQQISKAVIAVSGGIDSALSLTLLARVLPKDQIFPVLLPYQKQSIEDSKLICTWNNIPTENIIEKNIGEAVDTIAKGSNQISSMRLGNIMARVRMIFLYDIAKEKQALVCGTENISEKYLGYFTRFGDEASDIEPIQHLYKTQVREIAQHLQIPEVILHKAPTAGLWEGQTDEQELGFSYEDADNVMNLVFDEHVLEDQLASHLPAMHENTLTNILQRIYSQQFKHEVPYSL